MTIEAKPVSASSAEYTAWTQPNDANGLGTLFGGRLMQWVDLAAALAASRHARSQVVTASIDSMTFLRPVRIGQLVILKSAVNRVFKTSMEVGVKVFVEDLRTGGRAHVSSAYLTFVAVGQTGERVPLPPVLPESESERRRYAAAGERRQYRLQLRTRALEHEQQTGQ